MSVDSGDAVDLRCANHPDTVTHLRCSRCGKPICVKCVVQTPVGGRCRDCAQIRKNPLLVVGPQHYLRAALYGLGVSLLGGAIWANLGSMAGFSWLVLLLLGYAIGESVSRGAHGKVSRGLIFMAGGFTLLGVVAGRMVLLLSRVPSTLPLGIRLELAFNYGIEGLFTNILGLLFIALAVVMATSRVR